MILRVVHTTVYNYSTPAYESHNEVRLMPSDDVHQRLLEFQIDIKPFTQVYSYETVGGTVHHFGIRPPHSRLEIATESTVETYRSNPFDGLNLINDDFDFYLQESTRQAYAEFLAPSPYVPEHSGADEIAEAAFARNSESAATFLLELNKYLCETLDYDPDATHVHSTLDDVISGQAGVCQDFAHLMIACARSRGIPARYVSGYLYVEAIDQGLRGEQATHAWVECLMPNGQWTGFDPTNNLLTGDRYIKVHVGRDYSDVSPTKGVYVGTPTIKLEVKVRVEKLESAVMK
jgi:transglutaminase-like putative cysteine protease